MPKPKALNPTEARATLAHRFGPRADRLRQFATKFGIRPHRVFLVWMKASGDERGEGREVEIMRIEILPTPKVTSLDSVALNPTTAGIVPLGSIRVEQVSSTFTADQLTGKIPEVTDGSDAKSIGEKFSFFYEVQEDGRGDDPSPRWRYRLASTPMRRAEKVDWMLVLERISEDRTRDGKSQLGDDY